MFVLEPPPKRDFLKENMMRIRRLQESRRNSAVHSNKPFRVRRYCDSANSRLSVEARRPPMSNLRKSASCASICRDDSTQTTDINDEMFLKDVIIRFPSASLIRKAPSNPQLSVQSQTQTKDTDRQKYPYNNHNGVRKDQHTEKLDRHISDLSEYLERTAISKKTSRPNSSILKSSNPNYLNVRSKSVLLNESLNNSRNLEQNGHGNQRSAENGHNGGDVVVISDEDDSTKHAERKSETPLMNGNKNKDNTEIENDPDCPEGHVPLTEKERLEALQIAKRRKCRDYMFLILM